MEFDELYLAYRKAIKEAFGDTNCAHALKFETYESELSENLRALQKTLNAKNPRWPGSLEFIGRVTCIPKSVDSPTGDLKEIHCQESNPLEKWKSHWSKDLEPSRFLQEMELLEETLLSNSKLNELSTRLLREMKI